MAMCHKSIANLFAFEYKDTMVCFLKALFFQFDWSTLFNCKKMFTVLPSEAFTEVGWGEGMVSGNIGAQVDAGVRECIGATLLDLLQFGDLPAVVHHNLRHYGTWTQALSP